MPAFGPAVTEPGRRDVLRTLLGAAGLPALLPGTARRRRVGIVGGGMAGVSLAWLLDGSCDVVLLEARESLGGNIRSLDVELDGHRFVVDMGAQYFHPGPYPLYAALLSALGLYPPGSHDTTGAHAFPASITVSADGEPAPRFVSPLFPGRAWPVLAPWNWEGLQAFGVAFKAAQQRERRGESWALTMEEWLGTLALSSTQRDDVLLPWVAALFSGSIAHARALSARAAMIYAARAVSPNPLQTVVYYSLGAGMTVVLRRLLDQCSAVAVLAATPVRDVTREPFGGFRLIGAGGRTLFVDDLVFASSGPGTLRLLERLPHTDTERAALGNIEFGEARLALHTDPVYAAPNPSTWSFLNCVAEGESCEASMWLADVITGPPRATAAKLWKSWVTRRSRLPAEILHEAEFAHMIPTPSTIRAQDALRRLQGRSGIWYAGGYLFPYDSQETALRSALLVALALGASSARSQALQAATEPVPER